jgi:regulator of sigma E protease
MLYFLGAVFVFSVLIIGHEFGHFIMAKANGVKVEEFSMGMGPKILSFKGKETEYMLKLFPIGGYVRMLGDEEESTDERAFSNKSPQRKLSIIAAGPIMNIVMSVGIFVLLAYTQGYMSPTISQVVANSPAETVGLMQGDVITRINNSKVITWDDITSQMYAVDAKKPLSIVFTRNGVEKSISLTPIKDEEQNKYIIGIYPTKIDNPKLGNAIIYGAQQTKSLVKQTFITFKTLFQGKLTLNDFGGPVTIVKVSGQAAQGGLLNLLWLCAFLSVQLAIFNIIPFPALDGGWIFLFLFEIITRKKVSDDKIAIVNKIGFTILLLFMVLVTVKDIMIPINF